MSTLTPSVETRRIVQRMRRTSIGFLVFYAAVILVLAVIVLTQDAPVPGKIFAFITAVLCIRGVGQSVSGLRRYAARDLGAGAST